MIFAAYCHRSRFVAVGLAVTALALSLASAEAAPRKSHKEPKTEQASKPSLVATFGDWNVFVSQTPKGRICYVLAQPKTREPDGLNRDPGYAFISDRPSEGVRNEVSFIMGFDVLGGAQSGAKDDARSKRHSRSQRKAKAAAGPVATVGDQTFDLLPKGADLWVKNAARESTLIAEMKKGMTLQIRAASLKGNELTDSYSLAGFSQAMERLQKECGGKA